MGEVAEDWGTPAAPTPLRRVLVVVDGRSGARAAIAEAVALAREHGAGVLLAPGLPEGDEGPRLIERLTDRALKAAQRSGVPAAMVGLDGPVTASRLCEAAVQGGCDLIVAPVAPGTAVARLLKGSLVPRLITAATVPVLVVPDAEKSAPRRIFRRHRHSPGSPGSPGGQATPA